MIKRLIPFMILMSASAVIACCGKDLGFRSAGETEQEWVAVEIATQSSAFATKSMSPDENRISDLNVYVFSSKGELEDSRYLTGLNAAEGRYSFKMDILRNNRYSIYVCANLGYKLNCRSKEEILDFRYYLSRSDDFALGVPMSGCLEDVQINGEREQRVTVPLQRAVARIRLRIDRSQLDKDVTYLVRGVRIVGCPKAVRMFGENKAETADGVFASGFSKLDYDADALNDDSAGKGRSQLLDVYMLENMQGSELNGLCSYIEMQAMYNSKSHYTLPGKYLTYRFYLGNERKDFNVQRNCSYVVTVTPRGDGTGSSADDSSQQDGRGDVDWRIDKEDLLRYVESVSLDVSRLDFNYKGQSQTIQAEVKPEDAGNDLLEWRTSNPEVAVVNSNGTVTAVGDGSCTITCWSTDGSGCSADCTIQVKIAPAWVKFHNDGYNESRVGESMHVWADYFPPNMKCEITQDYLDYDVERGIYEYELSEDKSSVWLHFKNPGSGLFHFEVGEPLDTSTMVWIHVYPLDWGN